MKIARGLLPLVVLASAAGAQPGVPTRAPVVRAVDMDAPITPVSALRITKAIDLAEEQGNALVLIRLDTPGGLVESVQTVVKRILASEVPVVSWVGPSGARAASGGFFVLLASDVAAMAPGTRTGAAATIYGVGENREGDVLLKKMNEDNAALLRSLAERRGFDPEAAEAAVFSATAYEDAAALDKGLVDLIAPTTEALLAELDGLEVRRFDDSTVVLDTTGAVIVETEFSMRHEFMELLGTPIVASLLLLAGLAGLWIEFTTPGVVLPGVVGALCLVLFALSAQVLPISAIGLLLIGLSIVMFVLEIKVVSYGMLTLGGAAALVVGIWMLVDGPIPALRVPLVTVVPLVVAIVASCALAMRFTLRAQRERVGTGAEGLVSETGTVTQALAPDGKVFVHGEIWDASSPRGSIAAGARVRVVRVDELRLVVEPVEGAPAGVQGEVE